jgi:hypothetical protein
MMWVWAVGAFSVVAVVNQIAIAVCRRAQVPPNPIFTSSGHPNCSLAGEAEFNAPQARTSQASFLIASRRFDTAIGSIMREPAMLAESSVWRDQTPL